MGVEDMQKFMEKYELKRIHTDFIQKIILLVIASLGFISALAWDQALKAIFAQIFGGIESIGEKLLYSVLITVAAALVSIVLAKLILKKEKVK